MTAQGWPFLVARGHLRGYSVLLAPRFLLDTNDYGFLEEAAGPVRESEPPRVLATSSSLGRSVCLVWSEHPVTAADRVQHTRDEHSRPLRMIAGFVCTEGTVGAPSRDDLGQARAAAIDTYRRFLAGEDVFTVEPSTPFPLRSPVTAPAPRPARPVPAGPARPRVRLVIPLTVAGLIVAATTTVIALASTATDPEPPRPTCVSPATITTTTPPPLTAITSTTPPRTAITSTTPPPAPAASGVSAGPVSTAPPCPTPVRP